MQLGAFFKLIRWKNLVFIIYLQLLLKYIIFSSLIIDPNLNTIQFVLLLLGVVFITAAGYIINDIFDLKTDLINRPSKVIISKQITIEKATFLYKIINSIGIFMGIALALQIQKPTFSLLFISASILLYYYSKIFKSQPIIGNIIVSFLIALSTGILFLAEFQFEILLDSQFILKGVFIFLISFAFILNFIREIIKDIEDIIGDHSLNMKTLPIILGIYRIKRITAVLCFIPIFILINFSLIYKDHYPYAVFYLLITVVIPLFYIGIKLFSVKSKHDFRKLSQLLKIIMFLGINAVILIL